MKKSNSYFITAILIVLTITGCNKFLEIDPKSSWKDETFYSSKEEANLAISGIYSQLATDDLYGSEFNVFLEAGTDETYTRTAGATRNTAKYAYTSSSNEIKGAWLRLYTCIQLINQFETNLKPDLFAEEEYNNLLAKVRFIRGFCYFTLASWYGPVPLRLTPSTSQADNDFPPSPVFDVYKQVEKDYLFAAEHLLHAKDPGYIPGEPNKMAAHGLLARLYLKMGGFQPYLSSNEAACYFENPQQYFDKAKEQCEIIIIEDGWHHIVPYSSDPESYRNHFISYLQDRYDLRESLFEISFGNLHDMGIDVSGRLGNMNGVLFAGEPNIPRSFGSMIVGVPVYEAYSMEDARRAWSIAGYRNNYSTTTLSQTMRYVFDDPLDVYYNIGKFRRWEPADIEDLKANSPIVDAPFVILNNTPGSATDNNFTSINFPILRYSDVLLMHAEAIIGGRNGTADATSQAVTSLNIVRERAGLDPYTGSISHSDFFNELVDERLRELCFEALRKQDLIRWNLLEDKLQKTNDAIRNRSNFSNTNVVHQTLLEAGVNFDKSKHLLLPYPLQETLINGSLKQRVGSGW